MRNYEERAKDFIKEIFPYIENCDAPFEALNSVKKFNATHNRNVIVRHGIARIALITSDYVVKFNYDPYEVEAVGGGEEEVELYAHAVHDGFDYMFAKVSRYVYRDHSFYIMPRIYGIGSSHKCAEHYMTIEEREWCERYQLGDLHCNNFGFRNGQICIVDYACRERYSYYDETF